MGLGITLSVVGAAMAAVFGGLGSSIGVSSAGSKGTGVLAEKPELFGKILVITALPGSQGVYGLLIAILTLNAVGILAGAPVEVSTQTGWALFTAGAIMGFSGLGSGIYQGRVAAGGIGALARNGSVGGKAIVLSVIIETYAIFGLLVSILIFNGVQI